MRSVMSCANSIPNPACLIRLLCASLLFSANLRAQQPAPTPSQLPDAPSTSVISGTVTDAQEATISSARITLENVNDKTLRTTESSGNGAFSFPTVAPGKYLIRITAPGFASWKIEDIVINFGENLILPPVVLGVMKSIKSTVDAITQEDLAEEQISAEAKQRIIGILPNFYVSYVSNAAPLTRKQKFKLALKVTVDPVTFLTTGVTAGIEQWQGDFAGYGQGFSGYARRYGATYGDRVTSTFFGAALLPSLLHQDPRYFYKGKGKIINRALYAISTVVICKGEQTDTGNPTTPTSSATSPPAASQASTIPTARSTTPRSRSTTSSSASAQALSEPSSRSSSSSTSPTAYRPHHQFTHHRLRQTNNLPISYFHKPAPPHHAPPSPHRCTKTESLAQSPQASAKPRNPPSA